MVIREGSLAQGTLQDLTKCEKEIEGDSVQCPGYFNFSEVGEIPRDLSAES